MFLYLASRYTDKDPEVMQARYEHAVAAVAALTMRGLTVYSPIVHFHPVAVEHSLPSEVGFWAQHCENMLKKSDGFLVLETDGWEQSRGVTWELELARDLNLGVSFVSPANFLITTASL